MVGVFHPSVQASMFLPFPGPLASPSQGLPQFISSIGTE